MQDKLFRIDCSKWHCWLRVCTFKIVVHIAILPFIKDVGIHPSIYNALDSLSPYILTNKMFINFGLVNIVDKNWYHMALNISSLVVMASFHIFKNNLILCYDISHVLYFFSIRLLIFLLIGKNSIYIKEISLLCVIFMSHIVSSCFV